MRRWTDSWIVAALVAIAGCGSASSPTVPREGLAPIVTVSGRVNTLQSAAPLAGASVTSPTVGASTTTDGSGNYVLAGTKAVWTIEAAAANHLPRKTSFNVVNPTTGLSLTLISTAAPFALDFYRELVRGSRDNATLQPLRRWTVPPRFFFLTRTVNAGDAVPDEVVDVMQTFATFLTPRLTGDRLTVGGFGRGPERPTDTSGWIIVESYTGEIPGQPAAGGQAVVGVNPGLIKLRLNTDARITCKFAMAGAFYHEVVHALGFWHTSVGFSVDNSCGELLPEVEYHARIAYSRPVGNVDPDTDLTYVPGLGVMIR